MQYVTTLLAALLAAGLAGCGAQMPASPAAETTAPVTEEAPATEAALYHGGAARTPEEALARALEDAVPPACPDCGAATAAELTASEELPVRQRDCTAMAQGTDAVYDLSLTYDWVCPACGRRDAGHTVTGNRVIVCHGWTS